MREHVITLPAISESPIAVERVPLLRVHEALKKHPILSLSSIRKRTTLAFATAASAMESLVEQGIAREITGKRRDRLFVYDRYLSILGEGTETP